jgi:hypothetical protein
MSLAPTAAVAQDHTHHEDTTTEQELAQRWTDYYQSTRVAPAKLDAWTRAWERSTDSTEPPTRATAPPRPDGPNGELAWLIVSLGVLAGLVAGLAVLAARFSGGGPQVRPAV